MVKLYGIPNCDTVKKARAWLQAQGVPFEFVDFKKSGAPAALLHTWLDHPDGPDWQTLLNRRGTTWRSLPPQEQAAVTDADTAVALMEAHPSAIKRPVVAWPDRVTVGFDVDAWAAELTRLPT
jgi:Spx/MgsR family transcriptional regulator